MESKLELHLPSLNRIDAVHDIRLCELFHMKVHIGELFSDHFFSVRPWNSSKFHRRFHGLWVGKLKVGARLYEMQKLPKKIAPKN